LHQIWNTSSTKLLWSQNYLYCDNSNCQCACAATGLQFPKFFLSSAHLFYWFCPIWNEKPDQI